MPDQATDFMKDYQAFAQQSWDAWMRYMQQQPGQANPLGFGLGYAAMPQDDLLTRSLANLKAYGNWLQQAAGAGLGQSSPWQQPAAMQAFLAAFNQPFPQAMAGLDSASAFGLEHQWQAWLQAMQRAGMAAGVPNSQVAAFGITREFQLDQQALQAAMQNYAQVNARYQGLLQQVNAQGIAKLQELLAQHAEPGKQVQSLKALYDLWVDAMEQAYAEMALSQEFREVFGALTNAQMQVRKLQQQQTEQMCRELGIPTRSEVNSLGERVQQLRRDLKAREQGQSASDTSLVDTLQSEIAALKRELAASKVAKVRSIERQASGENGKTPSQRTKATRSAAGKRK
ncbi:poly(R)-hydroxyalkanoic acid synthase subunit PhaE [Dyella flagellata]|uniref:Poly(3-hydroxyalkanoate) polymerase subunit PhaE n=1 Tax=Dyella flagellata TaxID=1867833 RepID=A0ABQ5X7A2_9GAMM|nr:poly(R)-hydroxyalkanoic acid synthase subunit PhaE [Dyella flagellata]GLQ87032.1 class III poly(R)-hydroxyalkanoic acid synthase subunit PhaE [Dyella flagellata]